MTTDAAQTLDAKTFGSTMGNAVWLMTMDKRYRDRPIREIEALEDWRSGENLVVVDVVSAFAEAETVREKFWAGAGAT